MGNQPSVEERLITASQKVMDEVTRLESTDVELKMKLDLARKRALIFKRDTNGSSVYIIVRVYLRDEEIRYGIPEQSLRYRDFDAFSLVYAKSLLRAERFCDEAESSS